MDTEWLPHGELKYVLSDPIPIMGHLHPKKMSKYHMCARKIALYLLQMSILESWS